MTKVAPSTCHHEYQDELYGKGMRVFNAKVAEGKVKGWRCTVCGREISDPSDDKASEKSKRNPAPKP
jgi:hypothetical protein